MASSEPSVTLLHICFLRLQCMGGGPLESQTATEATFTILWRWVCFEHNIWEEGKSPEPPTPPALNLTRIFLVCLFLLRHAVIAISENDFQPHLRMQWCVVAREKPAQPHSSDICTPFELNVTQLEYAELLSSSLPRLCHSFPPVHDSAPPLFKAICAHKPHHHHTVFTLRPLACFPLGRIC